MIIDRLYETVAQKGNVCIGLDTSLEYIPYTFRERYTSIADTIFNFNRKIIDATCDIASSFKVQIAYYEAHGIEGIIAYKRTLEYIRGKKGLVIADIKRGDISKTAEMYAKAHFQGDFESDFITLNPYMGMDSMEPYLQYVKNKEKGLFVLIRTSNEGAKDIQYLKDSDGVRVYDKVGEMIRKLSEKYMGECGYSSIGGVVGGTHLDEGDKIRKRLKNMFFLIPGYGAQGGGQETSIYLNKCNGGIVNSSRAILLAYKKYEDGDKKFDIYAREEAQNMREAIKNGCCL